MSAELAVVPLESKTIHDHISSRVYEQIVLEGYHKRSDVFAMFGATLFTRAREDQGRLRYLGCNHG